MSIYSFKPRSPRTPPVRNSVTGRDGFIIAQALYRFIGTEQEKPEREQQWSNLQDARAIFNHYFPDMEDLWAHEYIGRMPSLIDEKAQNTPEPAA
jgi:hypothetical protein